LITTEFECGNLVLGISEVYVELAKVVTGIWDGPETCQNGFASGMGHNNNRIKAAVELGKWLE